MTLQQLIDILALSALDELVEALQISSFNVPAWETLEPQYDPLQHQIIENTTLYPIKAGTNGGDNFKRTPLALQKLAVNRVSQAMFASPVHRQWNFDKDNERQETAIAIIEEIYRVINYIDSENLERGKKNNAACEIVTIWSSYETKIPRIIEGEPTKIKLTHRTYSPIDGYTIYAQNDDNGELLVVSISYKDADDNEYLDIYANLDIPEFRRYVKKDEWQLDDTVEQNPKKLTLFPVVHTWLSEPVWGGTAGTNLVEQLEEMLSYEGMYIKQNSNPTFTVYYGEGDLRKDEDNAADNDNNVRDLIEVGKDGKVADVTWKGATAATTARYERIRASFFETNQIPDNSFATLINSNTSAENKELVFSDVKAKAVDLGGEWTRMFYDELNIVLQFAAVMFSSYKTEFETISARSVIQPYNIKTKKDAGEFVATAGQAMSLNTQVAELDLVDNVAEEVAAIEAEQGVQSNQFE